MKKLAKLIGLQPSDSLERWAVSLVAVALKGERAWMATEDWDSAHSALAGWNATFGTIQTYGSEEEAARKATALLDSALAKLAAAGYTRLCRPQTFDCDNHDWRRVCRAKTPAGRFVSLTAYARYIDSTPDPWVV